MTLIDGSRVTPGSEKCMCDSPALRPDGHERCCDMPCWQRIGLTSQPCCPDCAALPDPEELLVPSSQPRVRRERVSGPDRNYWRVWVDTYCVSDGAGRLRSLLLAITLRILG